MLRPSAGTYARDLPRLVALHVLLCVLVTAGARADNDTESLVRAALLYKLTQFVSWPADSPAGANPADDNTFKFCYVGERSEERHLVLLEGRPVGDRAISVRNLSEVADIGTCNSMYFSDSTKLKAAVSYLDNVGGSAVLTIADITSFADNGGMIEINRDRGRLGFRINLTSAKNSGLQISAPLLQLATVIER